MFQILTREFEFMVCSKSVVFRGALPLAVLFDSTGSTDCATERVIEIQQFFRLVRLIFSVSHRLLFSFLSSDK